MKLIRAKEIIYFKKMNLIKFRELIINYFK
jgi:hypothetical protein